jgi:MoaA/NifB/PqqE/SkfB family radical SAM enzyme
VSKTTFQNDSFTENLSTIHWHLTDYCLNFCPLCSANAGPTNRDTEFGSRDIERVLDDAKTLGATDFEMSGGDPLLLDRKFILKSVDYAASKNIKPAICTTGFALSQEKGYAQELADAGLEKIKLSLHGTTPGTHDAFTKFKGSHENVRKAIEYSKNAGIKVWVNAIITPQNIDEIEKLSLFLNPSGVDMVQLSSIISTGRGMFANRFRFTEKGLKEAVERLKAGIPGLREDIPDAEYHDDLPGLNYIFTIALFPYRDDYPFAGRFCDYFVDRLAINSDGDVIPCCLLPQRLQQRLGNIKKDSLLKIYAGKNIEEGSVFDWLNKGHQKMRRQLGYDGSSHNLCNICGDMLNRLVRHLI